MDTSTAPSLARRLASMLYDAMLLFGVLFVAAWLFSTLLQQRHALYLRRELQDWLILVTGVYFIWFWSHGGQTLAMKTWRIRLVASDGRAVGVKRAIGRYILAWLWVMPGLTLAWMLGVKNWLLVLIPIANIVMWSLTVYLDSNRQFLHDRMMGTRLIAVADTPPKARST